VWCVVTSWAWVSRGVTERDCITRFRGESPGTGSFSARHGSSGQCVLGANGWSSSLAIGAGTNAFTRHRPCGRPIFCARVKPLVLAAGTSGFANRSERQAQLGTGLCRSGHGQLISRIRPRRVLRRAERWSEFKGGDERRRTVLAHFNRRRRTRRSRRRVGFRCIKLIGRAPRLHGGCRRSGQSLLPPSRSRQRACSGRRNVVTEEPE